jgi:hypothetical protein
MEELAGIDVFTIKKIEPASQLSSNEIVTT